MKDINGQHESNVSHFKLEKKDAINKIKIGIKILVQEVEKMRKHISHLEHQGMKDIEATKERIKAAAQKEIGKELAELDALIKRKVGKFYKELDALMQ